MIKFLVLFAVTAGALLVQTPEARAERFPGGKRAICEAKVAHGHYSSVEECVNDRSPELMIPLDEVLTEVLFMSELREVSEYYLCQRISNRPGSPVAKAILATACYFLSTQDDYGAVMQLDSVLDLASPDLVHQLREALAGLNDVLEQAVIRDINYYARLAARQANSDAIRMQLEGSKNQYIQNKLDQFIQQWIGSIMRHRPSRSNVTTQERYGPPGQRRQVTHTEYSIEGLFLMYITNDCAIDEERNVEFDCNTYES